MECDKVQELLTEHLDGGLADGEGRGVERHLRECPRCADEEKGLRETLSLLRNLSPEKAPPELREGVLRRLAEEAPKPSAGKGLFASARIRIPIEAAAVVLLFLLVYGIQRQFPSADPPAAPPARAESPQAPAGEAVPPADSAMRKPSASAREAPVRPAPARIPAPGKDRIDDIRTAERPEEAAEPGAESTPGPPDSSLETAAAPPALAAAPKSPRTGALAPMPAVPATRVSTGAEKVGPISAEKDRVAPSAANRVFAAPPSRLFRPLPYGREVILEVAADQRPGIEDRIVRAAEGFGGSILREWHVRGTPSGGSGDVSVSESPMRIHLPADSAEAFLSELRKLGTIPPEGMPAKMDLPAGPSPDVVAYTVRIRVR